MSNQVIKELVLTALFTAIIVIMAFTSLGYIPLVVINATIIHIPVILGSLFCGPKKGAFLGFVFGFTSFIKNTIMPSSLSAFVFSPVLAASVVGTSGIFRSALICFVPRILVGVVPYFVYVGVRRLVSAEQRTFWTIALNVLIALFLFVGVRAFINKMFAESGLPSLARTGIALAVAVVVLVLLIALTAKKKGTVAAFVYAGVSGAMVNTLLVMGGIYVLYRDAYANALSIEPSAVLGVIGGVISFNGVIEALVGAIIVAAVGEVLVQIKPIAVMEKYKTVYRSTTA